MGGMVVVDKVKGTTVLSYIDEIKAKGLVIGKDFEWFYFHDDKRLLVKFIDDKYATFYQLKWSSK